MSNKLRPLAGRRTELMMQCAQQRAQLAHEFASLRSPASLGGLTGYIAFHKKTALAIAGVALALVVMRPKRMFGAATAALSLYKMVRGVLPLRHG